MDIASKFYRYSEANDQYMEKVLNTASDRKAKKLFKKIKRNSDVLYKLSDRLFYYIHIPEKTKPPYKDYYAILSVPREATIEEIKAVFCRLVISEHPDRHGNSKKSNDTFKIILEAYKVLTDPEKRRKYDGGSSPLASEKIVRFVCEKTGTDTVYWGEKHYPAGSSPLGKDNPVISLNSDLLKRILQPEIDKFRPFLKEIGMKFSAVQRDGAIDGNVERLRELVEHPEVFIREFVKIKTVDEARGCYWDIVARRLCDNHIAYYSESFRWLYHQPEEIERYFQREIIPFLESLSIRRQESILEVGPGIASIIMRLPEDLNLGMCGIVDTVPIVFNTIWFEAKKRSLNNIIVREGLPAAIPFESELLIEQLSL